MALIVYDGMTSITSVSGKASQCPSERHCSAISPDTYLPIKQRMLTGRPDAKDLDDADPFLTTKSMPFSERRWIPIVRRVGGYESWKVKIR